MRSKWQWLGGPKRSFQRAITELALDYEAQRAREKRENEEAMRKVQQALDRRMPWINRGAFGGRYQWAWDDTIRHIGVTIGLALGLWGCGVWFVTSIHDIAGKATNPFAGVMDNINKARGGHQ